MGTKITPFNLHTSVDSHVKGLIDSDYVQARSGSGGTDSASTQAMIDSNFANDITFGGAAGTQAYTFDGSDVIFDSAGAILFDKSDKALEFGDNYKAVFGAGGDLEIMHTGTYSRIKDGGTGNLVLAVDDLQVTNAAVTKNILRGIEDGAVELYHNDSKKLETTAYGSTVTGTMNADSATFGGGITVTGGSSGDTLLTFATDRSWSFKQSGDDATTRLQLRAASPSKSFDIINSSDEVQFTFTTTNDPQFTITSLADDADASPIFALTRNSASPAVNDLLGQIQFIGEDAASSSVIYGQITGIITDPTDGSEDGLIRFESLAGGNLYTAYQIGYSGNFFYLDLHLQNNSKIHFEGSTDDTNETTLTAADPTADRTITLPDASGTVALTSDITVTASSTTTFTNKTLTSPTITDPTITGTMNATGAVLSGSSPLVFEGSGVDANETTLAVTNPTADRTITLPDMTGRVNEVLISSGSMNSSSLNFNSSVVTSIYSELRLVIANAKPSTSAALYMRVGSGNSADTGTNYGQAIYYTGYYGSATAYAVSNVDHDGTNFTLAAGYASLGTGTGQNGHFEIVLLNPNTSSHYKFVRVQANLYSYYPMLMGGTYNAQVWKSTAAINYLQVYPSSGNLACDYKLYGIRS